MRLEIYRFRWLIAVTQVDLKEVHTWKCDLNTKKPSKFEFSINPKMRRGGRWKIIPERKSSRIKSNINNSHDNYSFLVEVIYVNMSREN